MNKRITFYINNEAYTVNIGADTDGTLQKELEKYIPTNKNIDTKALLTAYIQQTHKLVQYENELENIVDSLPTI